MLADAHVCALLEAAAARGCPSLPELRQAALEVLGRPVGHGTEDVEGLAGALFDHMDVLGQVGGAGSWEGDGS